MIMLLAMMAFFRGGGGGPTVGDAAGVMLLAFMAFVSTVGGASIWPLMVLRKTGFAFINSGEHQKTPAREDNQYYTD